MQDLCLPESLKFSMSHEPRLYIFVALEHLDILGANLAHFFPRKPQFDISCHLDEESPSLYKKRNKRTKFNPYHFTFTPKSAFYVSKTYLCHRYQD